MDHKTILRKQTRPINVINFRHLNRYVAKYLGKLIKVIITLFIAIIYFFASPIVTTIIVVSQMITGAVLGANLGLVINGSSAANSVLSITDFVTLWGALNPTTQLVVYIVLVVSIVKAIFDYIYTSHKDKNMRIFLEEQKSLPGRSWLVDYQNELNNKVMPFSSLLDNGLAGEEFDTEDLPKYVKGIMKGIRELAVKWDGVNDVDAYSSNIMFYLNKSSSVKSKLEKHWEKNKVFFDSKNAETALSQVSGVLAVVASSNHNSEKFFEPDSQHTPLMLPVCLPDDEYDLTHKEIPGAPTAFSSGRYSYLTIVKQSIRDWVDIEYWQHFSEVQANKLVDHYTKDKTNCSTLSMALRVPSQINIDETYSVGNVVGVLNLYSSKEAILKQGHIDFYQYLQPFLETLTKALILQEQVLKQDLTPPAEPVVK